MQALLLGAQVVKDAQHLGKEAVLAVGKGFYRLLAQVAQAAAARNVHRAAGGLVDACQEQQQRGFANPVRPDQADLGIVGYGDRNAREQVKGPERYG